MELLKEEIKVDKNEKEDEKATNIHNLIHEKNPIFAKTKFDIGIAKNNEARIKLLENKFILRKPYRCSFKDKQEIEKQIEELLKAKLIEESCCPYAAPVTMVFKKEDGKKTRLCIHFRELNKLIVPEVSRSLGFDNSCKKL